MTNLQEYQAGTDPHDPASVFRILSIQSSGRGTVAINFLSVSNRQYQVESATNLSESAWRWASPTVEGIGGLMTITGRYSAGVPLQFYRLKATP